MRSALARKPQHGAAHSPAAIRKPPVARMSKMEGVSQRSHKLMKGPLSYIGMFIKATQDQWSESNPEGWVPLSVAENKLANSLVLAKIDSVKDYPLWVMNYAAVKGIPELQQALARLLGQTFVKGVAINPEHICVSAGCSAIIDNLFYAICDEGDGVVIPAPYYPAFDNDLMAKNHLHPLAFYLEEGQPIEPQLDAALSDAAQRGIPVKALLVTNPNNPLGIVYSEATVRAMLAWCLRHKVHYVSDEIYACSIFKPGTGPQFVSAITLAQHLVSPEGPCPSSGPANGSSSATADASPATDGAGSDGSAATGGAAAGAAVGAAPENGGAVGSVGVGNSADGGGGSGNGSGNGSGHRGQGFSQREVDTYVHLVYGLSKDWCASGLRVGMLYSRNQLLQQALNSIAIFASIPNSLQYALAAALGDLAWAGDFLHKNAALLEKSYDRLAAVGGMFVWVDLRQWLPAATWEGEAKLWNSMCETSKVILTPGASCHAREPGFFRLCFAWVPPEALEVAVGRLAKQLKASSCNVM